MSPEQKPTVVVESLTVTEGLDCLDQCMFRREGQLVEGMEHC